MTHSEFSLTNFLVKIKLYFWISTAYTSNRSSQMDAGLGDNRILDIDRVASFHQAFHRFA